MDGSMTAPSAHATQAGGRAAGRSGIGRGVVAALLLVLVATSLVVFWPRGDRTVEGGALPVTGVPGAGAADKGPAAGPLALEAPWDGSVVMGTALEIRGTASRALGRIHAEVASGATILGSADFRVEAGGPFTVTVPLSAIGSVDKARLTISSAGARLTRVLASRDLTVCAPCL